MALMNIRQRILPLAVIVTSSCAAQDTDVRALCKNDGPEADPPATFEQIRLGMSYDEVFEILGEPGYSPTRGQIYSYTGDGCFADGPMTPLVGCGFIMEFRYFENMVEDEPILPGDPCCYKSPYLPDRTSEWTLKACRWGGIGE